LLSFAVLLFVANFAEAKVHWFSGRVVDDKTIPSSSIAHAGKIDANAPQDMARSRLKTAPAPTAVLVDVVVSLYNDPCGDDDGSTQDVDAGSAQQDKYEKIFQYFADGVYESTEGAHKIRNVRIYTNGKYASRANIQWHKEGHPHVPYKGGVNVTGGHINMYDTFLDGEGTGHNHDMLADLDGAGYTCAHEWGHYYYGLYDEYELLAGDVPVNFAIMNWQWGARGGNYKWLNFSIPWVSGPPYADYENTKQTKQHRVFGKSAWETLDSNTANDDANKMSLGPRTYYSELAAVTPAGANTPTIQLPGTARSDLDIIWMGDVNMVYQIVIDQSGSMSGIVDNAKIAAKFLVDKAEVNETKIGVIMFDEAVTVLQPIIKIDSQATKDAIKGIINGIQADGWTAIGDAAQIALNGLLALGATTDSKMVFLLTDGETNSDVIISPLGVIPAYQAAQVPIYAFAYGDYADTATLSAMASGTGGELYQSPTTMAEITAVFDDAFQSASDSQGVGIGSQTVNRRSETFSFDVDSTLGRLDLIASYDGGLADAEVHLYDPSGDEVTANSSTESGGETLYQYSIESPEVGQWTLGVSSNAGAINFSYQASGLPKAESTYSLSVDSSAGTSVTYPASVVLTATMEKGLPIAGASVFAQVEAPDGAISPFTLRDDGVTPDSLAGDGKYTGILVYRQDGLHKISIEMNNSGGNAALTYTGAIMSATVDGNLPSQIDDEQVGEDFSRSTSLQVTTSGVPYLPESVITIDKCAITAGVGAKVEMDSITCSGRFDDLIEESDINSASEIAVRIYTATNPTGYRGTIAFNPASGKKGKYSCKYKIPKGGSGAITVFNLDLNKQTFSFQAKDISLGGLDCPLSIKIEIGDYIGVGIADEDIVNGPKKLIPTILMGGYADTLKVGKWSVKPGKIGSGKGDSLSVSGSIASQLPVPTDFGGDPYIGTCTLTWGFSTFVFDLQFHHDRYYAAKPQGPLYETPKGTLAGGDESVVVKIDFGKGTFTAQIKGATPDGILESTGPVTFGIAFTGYTGTGTAE
jgi:uncharacterized protein YegL